MAGGISFNGTDDDFAIARYNSNGVLDNTFGVGGKVITDIGSDNDGGSSVVIQSDGKIVLGGVSSASSNMNFALLRYNINGTLDSSFGTSGKTITDFAGGNDYGASVALQNDDKIILAGHTNNSTLHDFAIARYNSNGVLDITFGIGGKINTDIGGSNDLGQSTAIQSDGKIVLAGWCITGTYDAFGLARYNTNGTLDNTFGTSGKVLTYIGLYGALGFSVATQSDGKIVVGGFATTNGIDNDFTLARYNSTITVGIEGHNHNDLNLSPNPFTTQTRIDLNTDYKNATLKVLDVLGKELKSINFTGKQVILDREELNNGIYFIQIISEDKLIGTDKMIIN